MLTRIFFKLKDDWGSGEALTWEKGDQTKSLLQIGTFKLVVKSNCFQYIEDNGKKCRFYSNVMVT